MAIHLFHNLLLLSGEGPLCFHIPRAFLIRFYFTSVHIGELLSSRVCVNCFFKFPQAHD